MLIFENVEYNKSDQNIITKLFKQVKSDSCTEDYINALISYNLHVNTIIAVLNAFNDVEDNRFKMLLKLDYTKFSNNSYSDIRKMIVLIANDYETIVAIIIYHLVLMRKYKKEEFSNRDTLANISLNVYAPLAHRMGLNAAKRELEELSLYYLDHQMYMTIVKGLELKQSERDRLIKEMIDELTEIINKTSANLQIFGRFKSIYSIYKKMQDQNKGIDELFDLQAIRIICDDEIECYTILGLIHTKYPPIDGRFKDYIAVKKPNLYQSLHTSIIGLDNKIFEIQIRTYEMDEIAEKGIAAHFLYKEKNNKAQLEDSLNIYREIAKDQEAKSTEGEQIFESVIYALTPNNKIILLPKNASVIDFAYAIHSGVAETMSGAIVNGNIVKFDEQLQNGDHVEILTKKGIKAPKKEWLDHVASPKSKRKIKRFVQKLEEEHNAQRINLGMQMFNAYIKQNDLDDSIIEDELSRNKILRHFSCKRIADFYIGVAEHDIELDGIEDVLKEKEKELKFVTVKEHNPEDEIHVNGANGIKKQLAKCCMPVNGDQIVGAVVSGVGIKIHRKECHNVTGNKIIHLIDAKWNCEIKNNKKYRAELSIVSEDRNNLLADFIAVLTKMNISIEEINSRHKNYHIHTKLVVNVEDLEKLNKIISSLSNVSNVLKIERALK